MAKKTQSATGQQAQTEPPDQAEQKLPAEQQGGAHTFGPNLPTPSGHSRDRARTRPSGRCARR
jgi:hypothetical protein